MKTFFRKYIFATAGILLLLFFGSGTSTSTIKNPMELYLLVGQSNMAGRGKVEAIDTVRHAQVYVFNADDEWSLAKEPLHYDKANRGVGPGCASGKVTARSEEPRGGQECR